MKKSLIAITTLLLTACGGQLQTQPYNPYMMNQMGQQYGQVTSYGHSYQQNLYQQQGAYSYQAPNQTLTQPAQGSNTSFTSAVSTSQRNTLNSNATASRTPVTTSKTTAPATRPVTAPKTASQVKTPVSTVSVTQSLLQKTRARFESLQNFRAMADVFETKPGKGPVKAKLKVTFMKPGSSRLEIMDHSNSLYKGAKLTYKSGVDSITGRPGGAMSFMKMTLPMSDDKVTSRRGYRLDQVDTLAIVSRLVRPELNPKLLGKTTVNGRQVAVLEYQTSGHFDPLITKELLGIDMETHFVRIHEMYAGEELVYSLKLPEVQFDQPMTAADLDV